MVVLLFLVVEVAVESSSEASNIVSNSAVDMVLVLVLSMLIWFARTNPTGKAVEFFVFFFRGEVTRSQVLRSGCTVRYVGFLCDVNRVSKTSVNSRCSCGGGMGEIARFPTNCNVAELTVVVDFGLVSLIMRFFG